MVHSVFSPSGNLPHGTLRWTLTLDVILDHVGYLLLEVVEFGLPVTFAPNDQGF